MDKNKEELLNKLKQNIEIIRQKIRDKLKETRIIANKSMAEISKMLPNDQKSYMQARAYAEERVKQLGHMDGSPYFMKCEIVDDAGEKKDYFFSKHQFSEENIYSWVAPVAKIRFDDLGKTNYKTVDGTIKNIIVNEKEQYMIVDGKVIFFAKEEKGKQRELIYQEHFTKQKSQFALPEIVAQMEKAQDQVIRANHKGPLIISGPAGSGKTTLALHRVAYLTQAPDTAEFYPSYSVIVFVQDNGTKNYFSTLLPGLGINDVHIVTFSEWAMSVLGLKDFIYIERCGNTEEEKDFFEYQKLLALREKEIVIWNKNIYSTLKLQYESCFSSNNIKLFEKQKKDRKLDRFDLVILLQSYLNKYGKFETKREYQKFVKDKIVNKTEKKPVGYSLIVVDEFQNYLKEQLQIIDSCLSIETKSAVFVGDIEQQVKLGTIRNLSDIGQDVQIERNIKLNKVYRNTKNILSYIKSLGYKIEILEGLKDGPEVVEIIFENKDLELDYIKKNIDKYKNGSIGIISNNQTSLDFYKKEFESVKNIHVLSMIESQGVEFDIVFIVGINKKSFEIFNHIDILPEHLEERKRMQKDLLYVALTRAITELHVLGEDKLADVVK